LGLWFGVTPEAAIVASSLWLLCQLVAITSPLVDPISYVQFLGVPPTKARDVARYVVHLGAKGVG
jgi:hypothetical protein